MTKPFILRRPDIPPLPVYVSRRVLAERFNVDPATVARMDQSGELPSYRIGGAIRYDYDEAVKAFKEKAKASNK
jgi:hypothetical protein